MICPNCGANIADTAVFCGNCGTPMPAQPAAQPAPVEQAYQQPTYQQQPQQAYQQQAYQQQPYQQAAYQQYVPISGTSRALAMSAYWGLLPLIFAWTVGDKDTDLFLRHHLNQALVILIGVLIGCILAIILIGGIIALYLFVMIIMGTVHAYHGEMTELPLVGKIKILK